VQGTGSQRSLTNTTAAPPPSLPPHTTNQACVEYLRSRKLGRSKFILLDKVAYMGDKAAKPFAPPPGTLRLFDLVTPKPDAAASKPSAATGGSAGLAARLRTAFYFALRDTLVAPTIDDAVKIAYRPGDRSVLHRVVTLGGELIDNSGTMSGGGRAVRRGGMSSSTGPAVSAEELAGAEKEAAAAEAALADARGRRSAASASLRDWDKAWPRLGTRISKLEMEVASLTSQAADVRGRLEALLKSGSAAAAGKGAGGASSGATAEELARVGELEKALPGLEAESRAAAAAAAKAEAEVTALQRTILEAGGEKVRRAKARVDRADEGVSEVEKALAKAAATSKASEKSKSLCERNGSRAGGAAGGGCVLRRSSYPHRTSPRPPPPPPPPALFPRPAAMEKAAKTIAKGKEDFASTKARLGEMEAALLATEAEAKQARVWRGRAWEGRRHAESNSGWSRRPPLTPPRRSLLPSATPPRPNSPHTATAAHRGAARGGHRRGDYGGGADGRQGRVRSRGKGRPWAQGRSRGGVGGGRRAVAAAGGALPRVVRWLGGVCRARVARGDVPHIRPIHRFPLPCALPLPSLALL
jgi:hypothetical protein